MSGYTVELQDIKRAAETLKSLVYRTPTCYVPNLSEKIGVRIYLKLEGYQPTGSFKVRGVFNKLLSLSDEDRRKGIITASSGGHGLATAYASQELGIQATVCVPSTANPDKAAGIKRYGAELVQHGSIYNDSFEKAIEVQRTSGATFIHAFDDPRIIAGHGTIGIEIVEDLPEVDTIVVPIGGGGLISGISTAAKTLKKDVRVIGVEPEGAAAMYASIKAGRKITLASVNTIADGLDDKEPSEMTFRIASKNVDEFHKVSDDEIRRAMARLLASEKIIAEPSGAAGLAFVLYHYAPRKDEEVAVVITGRNVSRDMLKEIVTGNDFSS